MKRSEFENAFKGDPRRALNELFSPYGKEGFEFHPIFRPVVEIEKGNEQQALAIRINSGRVECKIETGLWVGINPPEQTCCKVDTDILVSFIKAHDIFDD